MPAATGLHISGLPSSPFVALTSNIHLAETTISHTFCAVYSTTACSSTINYVYASSTRTMSATATIFTHISTCPTVPFIPPSTVTPELHTPANYQSAPPVNVPCTVPPLVTLSPAMPTPLLHLLVPVSTIPSASEPEQSRQSDTINATLNMLAETVVALQRGLEAYLANLSAPAPCTPQPKAPQT